MSIFNIFKKRQESQTKDIQELYEYNLLSEKLRRQIILQYQEDDIINQLCPEQIYNILRKELGLFNLTKDDSIYRNRSYSYNNREDFGLILQNFILNGEINGVLSYIESYH